jgi:hypothetical protein
MEAVHQTAGRLAESPRRLEALSAICLPHLQLLLDAIEDPGLVGRLLKREATIIGRLSEDMKRYALKRDAVRRHLLSEEETNAARQALLMLVGHRNVMAGPALAAARDHPAKSALGCSSSRPAIAVEVLETNSQ